MSNLLKGQLKKIGINLTFLYEKSGIGVYVFNILKELLKINTNFIFYIFFTKYTPSELLIKSENFKYIKIPCFGKKIFFRTFTEQIILPVYLLIYKIKIIYTPSVFIPILFRGKRITILHDLSFLGHRGLAHFYFKFLTKIILKRDFIITISNFSKKEILDFFQENFKKETPPQIKVIYEAPPLFDFNQINPKEIFEKFGISDPYFFYIGLLVPRKNISNSLKAFKIFIEKYKDKNFNFILAGPERKNLLNINELISQLGLQDRVKYLGFITEEEKMVLYKNSIALVFPSFHEGFGLPVLEAQSLGVPVITSNVTSLPEIAGDGALFVDPYNVEEIANAMEKIAFDNELRNYLIQKGYENIKRFSWKKTVKELIEVFSQIYEDSSSK